MKRGVGSRYSAVFIVAVLLTGVGVRSVAQDAAPTENGPPTHQLAISQADWDAIRRSAERYAEAFNAGDAVAIAALYAEHAELIDASGNVFLGRPAIQQEYAAFFEAHPDAAVQITVENVRSVSEGIVTEDGRTETRLGNEEPVVISRYVAIHGKGEDGWHLMSVRDFETQLNEPGADLEQLRWLIGQWIDEDDESLLEIDCYWHESGAYLIRDFRVRVEGLLAASGTERIGWDPLRMQIRSWLFDSQGGYLEGDWIRVDDQWTIAARGFRADGKPSRATYVVTPLRKDAYHMASFNRFAGETRLADLDMTVVRKPPTAMDPGDESADPPRDQVNREDK